jgi:tetratricopeptide (TPR) repeat protein
MRFLRLSAVCLCAVAWAERSPLPPDRLAKVRGVLDAVYRLEYDKAEKVSREMIRDWPEDPVGYVYLARVLWQQLLLEERALTLDRFSHPDFFSENPVFKAVMDPAAAQRFRTASEEAIRRARALAAQKPRDPAALYLLGAAFQNEASFQLSMNNAWLAAIRAGHQSYQAHRTLLALDANYGDAHLVTGIYNYAAGSLPWKIRWIALLLGYHGSKERGRAELEAAAKGGIVADDALTVLVLLDAIDERWDLAIGNLEKLRGKYPENYLLSLDLAGLDVRRGRPAAAAGICRQLLAAIDAKRPGFARLDKAVVFNHLAIALRAMKDYAQAEKWLRLALSGDSAPARSRSVTLLELGKTLDLAGRRDEALQQYRLVRQLPDYANSHHEAAQYLGHPYQGK